MPYLALDYGEKRVGVAVSPDGKWAFERPTLVIESEKQFFDDLQHLINEEEIDILLIGLPLGLKGNDTSQTEVVRSFAGEAHKHFSNLRIELVDERLTTKEAQKRKKEAGEKNIQHADSLAAKLLLEQYLG